MARWYSRAVLSYPGGKSALLATEATSTSKPIPESIPNLLRNILQELRWGLSTISKRTKQKEAYCALGDERR